MFPVSVNQQCACEVAWLNYFTIYSRTQRSVSSHTVAKDLPSSGLAVFVKQTRAMSKTELSFANSGRETHSYSYYLPTHNYLENHLKWKKSKNLADPSSKWLRV